MDVIAGAPDWDTATGYVAVYGGRPREDLPSAGPLDAADAVVRGLRDEWRAGDDAVYLDESFAAGDFSPLLGWLQEKVYAVGQKQPSAQLVEQITGEPLGCSALIRHLRQRRAELELPAPRRSRARRRSG